MRIAFDIDGVILSIDLGLIKVIDCMKDKKAKDACTKFYFALRRRQLNPCDFLHEDDELYIITARGEENREITERWIKRYFPMAKLIMLSSHEEPTLVVSEEWYIKQAKRKAKALIENKIDVYFEDTAPVVRELRKLCPNTKIIQYGARFDI